MKAQTSRSTVFAMLLGLTLGTAVAATDVNAGDLGPILEGAIHDYDGSTDTYTAVSKGNVRSGYLSENILDESYHDYDRSDALAFNENVDQLEEGEFAALEEGVSVPWEISSERDW